MAYILKNNARPGGSGVSNIITNNEEIKYIQTGSGGLFYDIQQYIIYDTPELFFSYPDIITPAKGGSIRPIENAFIQKWRRVGYSGNKYEQERLDEGATITYTVVQGEGATVDDQGEVTWESRGIVYDENPREAIIAMTVSINGKENTAVATVKQDINIITNVRYDVPTGKTLAVPDIPAKGGVISEGEITGEITQLRTDTYSSEEEHPYIIKPEIDEDYYSDPVWANSLENNITLRSYIGILTYYYICNGVTGSCSADVYQQANFVTEVKVETNQFYYEDAEPWSCYVSPTSSHTPRFIFTSEAESLEYPSYGQLDTLVYYIIQDNSNGFADCNYVTGELYVESRGVEYDPDSRESSIISKILTFVWNPVNTFYGEVKDVQETKTTTCKQKPNIITQLEAQSMSAGHINNPPMYAAYEDTKVITNDTSASCSCLVTFSSQDTTYAYQNWVNIDIKYSWTTDKDYTILYEDGEQCTVTMLSRGLDYDVNNRKATITRTANIEFSLKPGFISADSVTIEDSCDVEITQSHNTIDKIEMFVDPGKLQEIEELFPAKTSSKKISNEIDASAYVLLTFTSQDTAETRNQDYGTWSQIEYTWDSDKEYAPVNNINQSSTTVTMNSRLLDYNINTREALITRKMAVWYELSSDYNNSNLDPIQKFSNTSITITQAKNVIIKHEFISIEEGRLTSPETYEAYEETKTVSNKIQASTSVTLTFSSESTTESYTNYGDLSMFYTWESNQNYAILESKNVASIDVTMLSRGVEYDNNSRTAVITRYAHFEYKLKDVYNNQSLAAITDIKKSEATVTQNKNIFISGTITANSGEIYQPTDIVPAKESTITIANIEEASLQKIVLTFSSRSETNNYSVYGTLTGPTYSWESNQNYATLTSLDSPSLNITLLSRGTDYDIQTRKAIITRNVLFEYSLKNPYTGIDPIIGENKTTSVVTQQENIISIKSITVNAGELKVPEMYLASGGIKTVDNKIEASASGVLIFTSESEVDADTKYGTWLAPIYSWESDQDYALLTDNNSISIDVEMLNRTNIIGGVRSASITREVKYIYVLDDYYGGLSDVNSDSTSVNVSQEANIENASNEITEYGKPIITTFEYNSVEPNEGNECIPTVTAKVINTRTYYYTSKTPGKNEQEEGTCVIAGYETIENHQDASLDSVTGIVAWNANISSQRSVTIQVTVVNQGDPTKFSTSTANAIQLADYIIGTDYSYYVSINAGDSYDNPLSAKGGSTTLICEATTTEWYTWKSGDITDYTYDADYTISGSGIGFTRDDKTVTADARGTITGEVRSVTYTITHDTDNTVTDLVTIYQEKNERFIIEDGIVWDKPIIYSEGEITASGGKLSISSVQYSTRYYHYEYTDTNANESYRQHEEDYLTNYDSALTCDGDYRFSFDGTTLSHSSMLTDITTDVAAITATGYGDQSNSILVEVTNSVEEFTSSIDSFSYDNIVPYWGGSCSPSISVSGYITCTSGEGSYVSIGNCLGGTVNIDIWYDGSATGATLSGDGTVSWDYNYSNYYNRSVDVTAYCQYSFYHYSIGTIYTNISDSSATCTQDHLAEWIEDDWLEGSIGYGAITYEAQEKIPITSVSYYYEYNTGYSDNYRLYPNWYNDSFSLDGAYGWISIDDSNGTISISKNNTGQDRIAKVNWSVSYWGDNGYTVYGMFTTEIEQPYQTHPCIVYASSSCEILLSTIPNLNSVPNTVDLTPIESGSFIYWDNITDGFGVYGGQVSQGQTIYIYIASKQTEGDPELPGGTQEKTVLSNAGSVVFNRLEPLIISV